MRAEDLFFTVLALGGAALVLGRVHSLVRARRYAALPEPERRTLFRQVAGLAILSAGLGALVLIASLAGLWDALRAAFTPVGVAVLILACLAYALRLRGKAATLGQPRLRPEEVVAGAWIVAGGGDGGFAAGDHGGAGGGDGG